MINGFLSVGHTTHFSRKSLDNCLRIAGWEAVESVEQQDYNGLRVLAKPSATNTALRAIKTHSTDWKYLVSYLETWYSSLKDAEEKILSLPESKQFVIWGAGCHTEFLYQCTSLFSTYVNRMMCLVDSDTMKQGKSWRGLQVHHPDVLTSINWESAILLISSYGGQKSMRTEAINKKVPEASIIEIYSYINKY